ncbi:somatostatin receptor type 5-like [Oculina patagonica]
MAQSLDDRNTATVVSETALFSLLMIFSLVGNILVCFAVYRNPRLRQPSNYYIISLAMSDISQALCAPLSIVMLAIGYWPFGTSGCYFMAISMYSLTITSVYTLVLMALNRYYKIVKPAKYQTTFKKRFIILTASLVWVFAILYNLFTAFVLGSNAKLNPGFGICVIDFRSQIALPVGILVMYLPYFIIIFCYWKIHRFVKMHNANVSWQSSNVEDVKISKTLFITVVRFVSLWMPAHSIFMASHVWPSLPREVKMLATFLVFLSSCVNPFIYAFMNRVFRNEFKKCLMLKKIHSIGTESS